MKNLRFAIYASILCLALFGAFAGTAMADVCNGTAGVSCGTSGADGAVPLSPTGNSSYQWISTNGGLAGVGVIPVGAPFGNESNGTTFATSLFTVNANSTLNFYFDYVTTDGTGFADYAWAELFDSSNNPVALLFTAQTETSGNVVPAPGIQLPDPSATLTPSSTPITPGLAAATWSPLGADSGSCFISPSSGCGNTGWILSNYVIQNAGTYFLEVGVTNAIDFNFQSGLAFDGITINGVPITGTPEPGTLALLGFGMLAAVTLKLIRK